MFKALKEDIQTILAKPTGSRYRPLWWAVEDNRQNFSAIIQP